MSSNESCPHCGAVVPVSEAAPTPWLECPKCRARVVNPNALRARDPARLTVAGVLGTLLVLAGCLGWFAGCAALFVHAYSAAMNRRPDDGVGGLAVVHTLCSVFLVAAGFMLLRAGADKARRPLLLVASGFAVFAVIALLFASGLVVVFVTCFNGS
jgi:hypothetical protein